MKLALWICLVFLSSNAFAQLGGGTGGVTGGTNNQNVQSAILSISPSGYSALGGRLDGDLNQTASFLRGGTAGTEIEGCLPENRSNSSVCNNCAADFASCNTRRIHDDLQITINFIPVNNNIPLPGGQAFASNNIEPGQQEYGVVGLTGPIFQGPNVQQASVTFTWGEMCRQFFRLEDGSRPTSCSDFSTPVTSIMRLGIDENGDLQANEAGVTELQISISPFNVNARTICRDIDNDPITAACNFRAYPGDGKVFIEELRTDCSFPSAGGSNIQFLRVFYKEVDVDNPQAPNAATQAADLALGAGGSVAGCSGSQDFPLENNEVGGLTNGTQYRFSIGLVDNANNLGGIVEMADAAINPSDDTCFTNNPDLAANCHVATPDEVFGLIEKEFDCFITTATYGTPLRPKVEDFREFRNRYLHTTWLGRKLIHFYYDNSPPVAEWIRNHPWSKPLMRGVLYPFWAFAKLSLEFPWLVLMGLLSGGAALLLRATRRGAHL